MNERWRRVREQEKRVDEADRRADELCGDTSANASATRLQPSDEEALKPLMRGGHDPSELARKRWDAVRALANRWTEQGEFPPAPIRWSTWTDKNGMRVAERRPLTEPWELYESERELAMGEPNEANLSVLRSLLQRARWDDLARQNESGQYAG